MKLQESELLVFNKYFTNFVRNYVHNTLDKANITHYIHDITDFSCTIYLGYISQQPIAIKLLLTHPFAKHSESGIDFDGEAWITIYF